MRTPVRFLALVLLGLVAAILLGTWDHAPGVPIDPAAGRAFPEFEIPPPAPDHQVCFVLGDMGTGRPDQHRVAEVMAKRARASGLDFMITVGDNFYPSGVRGIADPLFRSHFETVYDDPALAVPVHPTLGNHDHRGDPDAQVAYSGQNPRWRMPARFHAFTRRLNGGTAYEFFALDTTPLLGGGPPALDQLEWLARRLERSTARWKIVYGHHPLYSNGDHGGSAALRDALEPLLIEHDVDLYLAGHDHHLELQTERSGIVHVIAGAAGGPDMAYPARFGDHSRYVATGGGLVLMRLEAERVLLEFIRMDGRTQYAHGFSK